MHDIHHVTPHVTSKIQSRRHWRLCPRKYRSARRHFRRGQRAAVTRAMVSARLYVDRQIPTLVMAAESCGSNVNYVRAAATLLRAEAFELIEQVSNGALPLLAAAKQVQRIANMVTAYKAGSTADRIVFGRVVGVDTLFDDSIAPIIA
jgi:hypothetical protein